MTTETLSALEQLALDPDGFARRIAGQMGHLASEVTSDLVYTPTGAHSFYRDLLGSAGKVTAPGCEQRLTRHAEQMAAITAERRKRALRALAAGGFEYRVEPGLTDGQGGYFSPPAWLNQLFATANRPRRVLADLVPKFPLPVGVSQINLPIIATGSIVQPTASAAGVPGQDITDSAGSSNVAPLAGYVDASLQLLELSPPGAHLDWAIFLDLSEAYDADLESQLISGTGAGVQLLGVTNVSGNSVSYTDSTPTGSELYPLLGQAFAKVSNNRFAAPQCWLMRGSRWAWLQTSEDTATLPFGIYSPFFLGNTDDTPDPIGGLLGLPVFLEEEISNTQGTGNQDVVICLRPSDMILLEGSPQTMVAREPLSATGGVRIEMHSYAAALTDRRPAGVSVVSGTGMATQTGF